MALTTAQATQNALNIAVPLQAALVNGGTPSLKEAVVDLCGAVIVLAEIINANASSLSSTVTPTNISIGSQFSGTASTTAPVFTSTWGQ